MRRELIFLLALWKANLLSAMEYRVAFISQVVGMMLNNAVYFVFWVIFFDRFKEVRGWGLHEMFFLFGVVAASFGLSTFLFGNILDLANVIANGRLDYYLALPRPVLLHVLASKSIASGLGDLAYGVLSFVMVREFAPDAILRFALATALAVVIFLSFLTLVQSLAFWTGSAAPLGQQAMNAMVTFSIYPLTLFDSTSRFLLLTIVPAALMGSVPAEFIRRFTWTTLAELLAGASVLGVLALTVFRLGLRRYESGSAIQVQM